MFSRFLLLLLFILGICPIGLFAQKQYGTLKTGSAVENHRNFFLETWKTKKFPIPQQYTLKSLVTGTPDATMTVYLQDSLQPVLPTQLGVNTTFRSGASMATDRIPLYQKSGWGVYRFPAGSGSNNYFWDGNLPDSTKVDFNPIDGTRAKYLTPAGFAVFKKAVNGEATVVVNYFYARYGITPEGTRKARVLQAARYAAGFVKKMNVELGAHVKYWEIGNECYGSWETGHVVDGIPVTGKEYGEDLCVFAREMKKMDSTIKIGAVVYSKDGEWNRQVLAEVKDDADFLVVHNYFTSFKHTTYQDIMSSLPQVGEIKTMLDNLSQTVAGKPAGYFPVAMTEYNNRGNLTTTMANAIFVAEVLGELMRNGYGMATLWVGEWRWSPGTHGIIAVSDPDQPDYSPRQAYMDFRYYHSYFGDYLIKAVSDNDSVKTYASRFSDGKTGLVVINESSGTKKVKVNLRGTTVNIATAWWYEIYADNISEDNKKFYINGQTGTTPGGGPVDFDEVKPYKATLRKDNLFAVMPYSVNFIVLDTGTVSGMKEVTENDDLTVFPNPFGDYIRIRSRLPVLKAELFNLEGKEVLGKSHLKGQDALNTSCLKPGVYFLRIQTKEGLFLHKVIKL